MSSQEGDESAAPPVGANATDGPIGALEKEERGIHPRSVDTSSSSSSSSATTEAGPSDANNEGEAAATTLSQDAEACSDASVISPLGLGNAWRAGVVVDDGYFNIDDLPLPQQSAAGSTTNGEDPPSQENVAGDESTTSAEQEVAGAGAATSADSGNNSKASSDAQVLSSSTSADRPRASSAGSDGGASPTSSSPSPSAAAPAAAGDGDGDGDGNGDGDGDGDGDGGGGADGAAPNFVVGQPVEIRLDERGQWSSARIVKRLPGHRVLAELSTKQQLEVPEASVRPLTHILHGAITSTTGSIKCGWLLKAPVSVVGRGQSYVSRFFVLNAGHLLYYRDENSKYPKGKVIFKPGDVLKKVDDVRISIELKEGYALKSTNPFLQAVRTEAQRTQANDDQPTGDRMVRTNGRKILLKAATRAVAKEWFEALSVMLESLRFAASLTSEQLQRYSWHPWITPDGAVIVRHAPFDPDLAINDSGWCMPLPIAVTSLINMGPQKSSLASQSSFTGKVWDNKTLEALVAWVVSNTPDNAAWRRIKGRPALATVKPELIRLLGRALVLLVRVGDADNAAIIAERAVLLAYAHVALATLSFSLSILSDAIQRMHCPPIDVLQSRKFSDPAENAIKALEYVKQDGKSSGNNSNGAAGTPVAEPISMELLYFIQLKAYNSLENAQRQRGDSIKKTEKDARLMKRQVEKALGDSLRAIPQPLLFPAVATPAPWLVKLLDEQKYLLSKNMIGHHPVLTRIRSSGQQQQQQQQQHEHEPETLGESGEKNETGDSYETDAGDGGDVASRVAGIFADAADKAAETDELRQCLDPEMLMAPRKYYSKIETLSRITAAFVQRKGFGNGFERSNTNIVEEALSYAAKPVSIENQDFLDRLWDVDFLRRVSHTRRPNAGRKSSDRTATRNPTTTSNDSASESPSSSSASLLDSSPSVSSRNLASVGTGTGARGGGGEERSRNSSSSTTRNSSAIRAAAAAAAAQTSVTTLQLERRIARRLSSRFQPASIDEDIEAGYFFRQHWWGNQRWRKLIQLMGQHAVMTPVYRSIKAAVIGAHGEETFEGYKEEISSYLESETFLKDCLERNLQARRTAIGRQRAIASRARPNRSLSQGQSDSRRRKNIPEAQQASNSSMSSSVLADDRDLANGTDVVVPEGSEGDPEVDRPKPPPPPSRSRAGSTSSSSPEGDASHDSAPVLTATVVDTPTTVDSLDVQEEPTTTTDDLGSVLAPLAEDDGAPVVSVLSSETTILGVSADDSKRERRSSSDGSNSILSNTEDSAGSMVQLESVENMEMAEPPVVASSPSSFAPPATTSPPPAAISRRQAQHVSATLPAISLREIPLSSIRARFRCYQKCAINNLCGHVDGLGTLYQEHADRLRAALQRVAFEVGFEKSSQKSKDTGLPKLKLAPERHESLSGLLNAWQNKLLQHADDLDSYGKLLCGEETMGNLKQYFLQSQRDFVEIARRWEVFEAKIHRAYRELNRARTTLNSKITAERSLRAAAQKKVAGSVKVSAWWSVALKAREFERWKAASHQAQLAFEDVMDCVQDMHFAIVQALLHKWKTADFLCRIEEHLINMQKKKIGSIIDGERSLCHARLAQLDRLYDTATSVDAESDLRMMTHSVQLRMQNVQRKQQEIAAAQQLQAQANVAAEEAAAGSVAGALNFVGRRLAEVAGSGNDFFNFDGLPAFPPLITSLVAADADDELPPDAEALIDAFIFELFEAHEVAAAELSRSRELAAASSSAAGSASAASAASAASSSLLPQLLELGFDVNIATEAARRYPDSVNMALDFCTLGGDAADVEAEERTHLQSRIDETRRRIRQKNSLDSENSTPSDPATSVSSAVESMELAREIVARKTDTGFTVPSEGLDLTADFNGSVDAALADIKAGSVSVPAAGCYIRASDSGTVMHLQWELQSSPSATADLTADLAGGGDVTQSTPHEADGEVAPNLNASSGVAGFSASATTAARAVQPSSRGRGNRSQSAASGGKTTTTTTTTTHTNGYPKVLEADRRLVLFFTHHAVRARFLRELNQRRQAGNVGPFFDRLKFLFYGLLDACSPTVDVDSIRQVMIMTQTYFRNRKDFNSRECTTTMTSQEYDSDREFLCNSELGKHPLWKNAVLWEEMFLLAVSQEVNKLPAPERVRPPAHLLLQSEWDDSPLQQDAVELFYASKSMHGVDDNYLYRYQQIAFGQLASLVLNMHKFGTVPTMIKQVVTRLASAYRVDHQQIKMLLKDLDRRLDSENPYSGEEQFTAEETKVQKVVNRLIRGDVGAMRGALAAAMGSEAKELTDEQLKRAIQHAIRKFHS